MLSAPFTNADIGTYTCSPNDMFPTIPPGDAITLSAASEYVHNFIILFIIIHVADYVLATIVIMFFNYHNKILSLIYVHS